MKSLIILLILAACLLSGTVGNYIYINEVSERLSAMIEALPASDDPMCGAMISELIDYWEEQRTAVCLSVSFTVADRISEQAAVLAACCFCGDRFGYYATLALLCDAVDDMRRLEQFSVENLL